MSAIAPSQELYPPPHMNTWIIFLSRHFPLDIVAQLPEMSPIKAILKAALKPNLRQFKPGKQGCEEAPKAPLPAESSSTLAATPEAGQDNPLEVCGLPANVQEMLIETGPGTQSRAPQKPMGSGVR